MANITESDLVCFNCHKTPEQLAEYVIAAKETSEFIGSEVTPAQYVMEEEGTLNHNNGHFACTDCYIRIGLPTAPGRGWKAP